MADAAGFARQLTQWALQVEQLSVRTFAAAVADTAASIVDGSAVTGAPGQPVDTGALKGSWITDLTSPLTATIATDKEYAPAIEYGVGPHGPLTLRSAVGGFGSVRATVAGWSRLVEGAVARVGR